MLSKLVVFMCGFSGVYIFLHTTGLGFWLLSERDLVLLVGMYSMAGFIFSVVSGFVIQSKWHVWDRLIESSHGEIVTIRQLILMSRHLPVKNGEVLRAKIRAYVKTIIENDWSTRQDPQKVDMALEALEVEAFESGPKVYEQLITLLHWKEQRDNYSRRKMPMQLRYFLLSSFGVVVIMSLMFTIQNLFYGLIFSVGIATLAYFLHLLVQDLDHPYQPGGWHFSSEEYKQLLL